MRKLLVVNTATGVLASCMLVLYIPAITLIAHQKGVSVQHFQWFSVLKLFSYCAALVGLSMLPGPLPLAMMPMASVGCGLVFVILLFVTDVLWVTWFSAVILGVGVAFAFFATRHTLRHLVQEDVWLYHFSRLSAFQTGAVPMGMLLGGFTLYVSDDWQAVAYVIGACVALQLFAAWYMLRKLGVYRFVKDESRTLSRFVQKSPASFAYYAMIIVCVSVCYGVWINCSALVLQKYYHLTFGAFTFVFCALGFFPVLCAILLGVRESTATARYGMVHGLFGCMIMASLALLLLEQRTDVRVLKYTLVACLNFLCIRIIVAMQTCALARLTKKSEFRQEAHELFSWNFAFGLFLGSVIVAIAQETNFSLHAGVTLVASLLAWAMYGMARRSDLFVSVSGKNS